MGVLIEISTVYLNTMVYSFLLIEKDVNSSTDVGTANETSWTSWALTSLSSNLGKLTTKPQQPSVNLTLAKSDSQNALSNTSNLTTHTKRKFLLNNNRGILYLSEIF